jgi:acetyl esterase/lipase
MRIIRHSKRHLGVDGNVTELQLWTESSNMPSIEHEEIVAIMAGGLGLEELSVEDQRAAMEASAGMFPVEADVVASQVDAGGVPADWITVDESEIDRVVLYFHGGGYVMGSRNSHRGLAGRIARAARARVFLPDYRLAPEHPFPAAVDDATTCWRWLVAEGHAPHHMAIVGDSAGGGLALATLLALRTAGEPVPACAVDDPMLTPEGLRSSGRQYAGADLRNPLAAPLHGDLEDLPPLLLQVGTREILLSDSTRFAEKARAAGVEVTLEIEEGLIHVWHMLPGVPEAKNAIERVGAFIQRNC